jgi:hypothetical protein
MSSKMPASHLRLLLSLIHFLQWLALDLWILSPPLPLLDKAKPMDMLPVPMAAPTELVNLICECLDVPRLSNDSTDTDI